MKKSAFLLFLALFFLSCFGSDSNSDDVAPADDDFELAGTWIYSGSISSLKDTLVFTGNTLSESGMNVKSAFSAEYTVDAFSTANKTFKLIFQSGTGVEPYINGDEFYALYELNGDTLVLAYGDSAYPTEIGDTEDSGTRLTFTKSENYFELTGKWTYDGSIVKFMDTLIFTNSELSENCDGKSAFSAEYTINEFSHINKTFKLTFLSGTGSDIPYINGNEIYVFYELNDDTLVLTYNNSEYPTGTGDTEELWSRLTFTKSEITFELKGTWIYSGTIPNVNDTLTITDDTLSENGEDNNDIFSAKYSIEEFRSTEKKFKLKFTEVSGMGPYAVGDELFFIYELNDDTLVLEYSGTGYPSEIGDTDILGQHVTFTRQHLGEL